MIKKLGFYFWKEVTQYLFQSPSSNPVQVGRLDPSSKKEDVSVQSKDTKTDQVAQNLQNFESQKLQDIKPVDTTKLLDIYA